MNKIKRDFIAKELLSLLGLMVLMAIALGYIIFYVKITPAAFLLLPLIVIAFCLRMSASASGSIKRVCARYSELWQERVGSQYAAPHPVYRVAYGEIHLLDACIVCRNKRRLILIPTEEIIRVEERFRSVGVKKVPLLLFRLDTDKTIDIDFSASRVRDGEAVLAWLTQRLGPEKTGARGRA